MKSRKPTSTSLRRLFVGDGSMWAQTKGGVLWDDVGDFPGASDFKNTSLAIK